MELEIDMMTNKERARDWTPNIVRIRDKIPSSAELELAYLSEKNTENLIKENNIQLALPFKEAENATN